MTASDLVVWRHGRTTWNATGRFQGQEDIGLDDLGRRQAAAAAVEIARLGIDRIVASDLVRARDTAQALAEVTGLPVATDARLREIHVGTWAGMTAHEVADVDPEYADAYARGEDYRRSATGETTTEAAHRTATALREIVRSADDGSTVVAAMHGLAGRVGMCDFLDLPYETWHSFAGLHNCAWVVLRRAQNLRWRLEAYNVTAPDAPTG